jgi:hypothetical protein
VDGVMLSCSWYGTWDRHEILRMLSYEGWLIDQRDRWLELTSELSWTCFGMEVFGWFISLGVIWRVCWNNYEGICRVMNIGGSYMQYETNHKGRSSVEVTVWCAKLVHLDVSLTGDEEDMRLTNESKLMIELGRLIKWTKVPWRAWFQ